MYSPADVAEIEPINTSWCSPDHSLFISREDRIHPVVSGNKYRKLKYNLQAARSAGLKNLVTFGGAFSNHIAAVAAAGREFGFHTVGYIRGEEWEAKQSDNPTLSYAGHCGMQLIFLDRTTYRLKSTPAFLERLKSEHGRFYLLPEGGTNALAVKGCAEILGNTHRTFDYICVSVGTGGTMAGILMASDNQQKIIGFSALKGTFQRDTIQEFTQRSNYDLIDTYCRGGYGKIDPQLVRFINDFKLETGVLLDPVYTAKMMFGLRDLLHRGYFRKNSRILAIHTGGTQGIPGMNLRLKNKKLPQIEM